MEFLAFGALRFSLILSKTIKLQVDFGAVTVEKIQDIPFRDDSGSLICDEDGKPLLHTDGTGYISEDLAMKCPKEFSAAKYITDNSFETNHEFVDIDDASCQTRLAKSRNKEAMSAFGPFFQPLLMQCRLFYNGCAVKGTLLVNKKLVCSKICHAAKFVKAEGGLVLSSYQNRNNFVIFMPQLSFNCFL
ncbi:UNVERIFIED_CONTAM: putative RNA-dependent RNA polymerase 3 [Sesamum angustifolium]|uniref:RNA-dependent RNA polymerase n=1 Tax=Sesamum angustifolium TaxID=2727405 RepID=A0AAW2N6G5_9LAMI